EIRAFTAADQRTIGTLEQVTIHAARELVLDEETAATAKLLTEEVPALAEQLGMLADGVAFEGMEGLVTAIHPTPAYLPDFVPSGSGVVLVDPMQAHDRAVQLV